MSHLINIKPLSVNEAWKGKRFKTDKYKNYESRLLLMLPKLSIPNDCHLVAIYEFGFSSRNSDWDNPVKPLQDILQKKYGFNDSRIVSAHISKHKVKKGDEYFRFSIEPIHGEKF